MQVLIKNFFIVLYVSVFFISCSDERDFKYKNKEEEKPVNKTQVVKNITQTTQPSQPLQPSQPSQPEDTPVTEIQQPVSESPSANPTLTITPTDGTEPIVMNLSTILPLSRYLVNLTFLNKML